MKLMLGWKKWLPRIHVHLVQVAAVSSRKIVFVSPGTIPSQLCMCECILWFGRLITSTPYVFPSTPSHWLTFSRQRSLCLGSNPWTCVKTSKSLMMVPHLNSIVFYYKTTTWSCSSWIACSQVCSRTSSCFGACYRSSFPENLATSSRQIVLQTLIFLLDWMGLEYPNTNQIWISGRYDGWNISQEL